MLILQRFIMVLSDHMVTCGNAGTDYNTPWFKNTIERLQQMFLVVSAVAFVELYGLQILRCKTRGLDIDMSS